MPAPGPALVHKITMVKPEKASYGFSIRGGVEHQIGIFVSEVEIGSEAHLQVGGYLEYRQTSLGCLD